MNGRRLYRGATSAVRITLAVVIGSAAIVTASAVTVVGVGLMTATPSAAYLGCPVGGGAIKGKVLVAGGGPPMTRASNPSYDGDITTQNTPFPLNVSPGGNGEFHYCGKGVLTWPVEAKAEYRINGPKVGKDLTGYIVDIHTKIPFKGDNQYTCDVRQEFGPKTVNPFYCGTKGIDAGSRYAINAEFTVGVKKIVTVTDPHQEARLLAEHCVRGEPTQCVFDSKNLNTNVYGPEESVTDAVDAPCGEGLTYTFSWSQTIATTENVGGSASLTVAIGKLLPIVQASVSATYGFSWTQSKTVSGTYPYPIPKGHRIHLVRTAKLNEVTGGFLLASNGDTNYVIPHATFKWPDPSGSGIISPKLEPLASCASS
jgi:hypothetical protein